jgi:putative CocE/NonD family hydrolase
MKHGSAVGKERHYLLMGPWDHAGTRTPKRDVGGLTFGEASMRDLNDLHRQWYDWTMKGKAKPKVLEKRVAYYVVGADKWQYADRYDAISNAPATFYLDSAGGSAGDVFHSGQLRREKSDGSKHDRYVYDPLDVKPAELEREEIKHNLTDQRFALNRFGNGLVYHSEPFPEVVEVSGRLKFTAFVALDVPDTDFQVDVSEILSDGSSVLLASDQKRARYRESLREARLVPPGEVLKYEFTSFNWISRQIAKGSRLRLVFGCPNNIQVQKNYNSGGDVSRETAKDARTAHVALHHDSCLELPVKK